MGFWAITESSKSSGRPSSRQMRKTARRGRDLDEEMERRQERRLTAKGMEEEDAKDSSAETREAVGVSRQERVLVVLS